MKAVTTFRDGSRLTVEHGWQTVWSMYPEPDPRWRFTDAAGHEHYYDEGSWGDDAYPTLRALYDKDHECYLCRGDDYEPFLGYECRECGEAVTPGMITGPHSVVIAGQQHAWLDNVRTDDPEYVQAALAKGAVLRQDVNGAVLDSVPVSEEELAVAYERHEQGRRP